MSENFHIIGLGLVFFCRYLVEPTAPDASKINPVEKKISTSSNYYESVDDVPKKSPGYQVDLTICLNIILMVIWDQRVPLCFEQPHCCTHSTLQEEHSVLNGSVIVI